MHRIKKAVFVILASMMAVVLMNGTALAAPVKPFEDEIGLYQASGPPEDQVVWCTGLDPRVAAIGCFQPYGDIWWVQDAEIDGYQVYVHWKNELWNGSSWILYREGNCNNQEGGGYWVRCNKDYYEDSSSNYYKKQGSRLWWEACKRDPIYPDPCSAIGYFRNGY